MSGLRNAAAGSQDSDVAFDGSWHAAGVGFTSGRVGDRAGHRRPPRGAGSVRQPEACTPVVTGADGNVGPVTCPDGHPNAYAMPALEGVAPHMIGLGEFATAAVIQAAACADLGSRLPGPCPRRHDRGGGVNEDH